MLIRVSINIESEIVAIIKMVAKETKITPKLALTEMRDVVNTHLEYYFPKDGDSQVMAEYKLERDMANAKLESPISRCTDLDLSLDQTVENLDPHGQLSEEGYVEVRAALNSFAETVTNYLVRAIVPVSFKPVKSMTIQWVGAIIIGEIDV